MSRRKPIDRDDLLAKIITKLDMTKLKTNTDIELLADAPCSILHLTLHRKWFDMIASGEKREEYRAMKDYWHRRLNQFRHYDAVKFVNGYGAHRPWMLVELKGKRMGIGKPEWGAPSTPVFILELGAILESNA